MLRHMVGNSCIDAEPLSDPRRSGKLQDGNSRSEPQMHACIRSPQNSVQREFAIGEASSRVWEPRATGQTIDYESPIPLLFRNP